MTGRAEGIPVLLVHGFASSFERNWREPGWTDVLRAEGREVIGIDLLGHGEAPRPHNPDAYAGMEQAIVAATSDFNPADAVGFSMGAQLLLRAAAAAPARFRRLVVAGIGDGVFTAGDAEPLARAVEMGEPKPDDGPTAAALAHFSLAAGNDRAALAACLRRPHDPLTEADLAAVTMPVLVILGERDFAGPAGRLVGALPDGRLQPLHGTDHFGTPKDIRFIQAALEFLRD